MIFECGDREYEWVENWGDLPEGWKWGITAGVAVDSKDRVHVFNRTEHPYIVFDRQGALLYTWGRGIFTDAHGIFITPDDTLYFVDREPCLVTKFTIEGRHLLSIGERAQPSDTGYTEEDPSVKYAGPPFNQPTDVSIGPDGMIYVSDGYRNCRVHVFGPEGELRYSFGEPGDGPGQFKLVHSVLWHKDKLYVCDRGNNRIQVMTPEGKHLETWPGFLAPCRIYVDDEDVMYVAELGARVSLIDMQGNVLGRWGNERNLEPGQFYAPHGIWVDSAGDIYIAETLAGAKLQKFARRK